MSKNGFVDDARQLINIAPSGNASITVLLKERKYAMQLQVMKSTQHLL